MPQEPDKGPVWWDGKKGHPGKTTKKAKNRVGASSNRQANSNQKAEEASTKETKEKEKQKTPKEAKGRPAKEAKATKAKAKAMEARALGMEELQLPSRAIVATATSGATRRRTVGARAVHQEQ